MVSALLVLASLALTEKQACAEYGEKLYAVEPELVAIEKAFRHCRPLAEAGDGEAQYYFASVFMFRTPSQPPDSPHVEMWMQRSADNGYGKAQFYMATVYRYGGFSTRRDIAKAIEMYEKAAAQGVPPAPLELARIYRHGGHGFPVDGAKAAYWYEFAARKFRMRDAMQALADLYGDGMEGVQKDAKKAQYWRDQLDRQRCAPPTARGC